MAVNDSDFVRMHHMRAYSSKVSQLLNPLRGEIAAVDRNAKLYAWNPTWDNLVAAAREAAAGDADISDAIGNVEHWSGAPEQLSDALEDLDGCAGDAGVLRALSGFEFKLGMASYANAYARFVGTASDELASGDTADWTIWAQGFPLNHRMNATSTTSGGWASTEMRTWANSDLLAAFPDALRASIKPARKRYSASVISGTTAATATTEDSLWLFAASEVFGISSYGDEGARYQWWAEGGSSIGYGPNGTSANFWWLRSVVSGSNFRSVGTDGAVNGNGAGYERGAAVGFCI